MTQKVFSYFAALRKLNQLLGKGPDYCPWRKDFLNFRQFPQQPKDGFCQRRWLRFQVQDLCKRSASIFTSLSYAAFLLLFHDEGTAIWGMPRCCLSVMCPPAALIWNRATPVLVGSVVRLNRLLWKKYFNGFKWLVGMSMQSYSLSCLHYINKSYMSRTR